MLTALLGTMAFFSCKKEAAGHNFKNDLSEVKGSLEGKKLIGSITAVTEDNESALIFNNGNELVIIGIPKSESLDAGTIKFAELIVSKYGVIIKDVSKNEVWLLANNDEESKRKFESVRAFFPDAKHNATIFDLIEINTGQE